MSSKPTNDPIADAILSSSTFEQVRMERWSPFKDPIPRKIRWQSYLLFGLAGVALMAALQPRAVTEAYFGGPPLAASPKLLFLGVFALVVLFITGVAQAGLGHYRLRHEEQIDRSLALELLAWEDVCSLFGLGTGGLSALLTLCLFGVGFGGTRTLETWQQFVGTNPYAASGLPMTVLVFACLAVAAGLVLYTVAANLHVAMIVDDRVDAVESLY